MAITVDWANKIINIPQADLTFISGTLYELDTDVFRLDLKALEAGEQGMPELDTHRHNTEVTVAGVTFARTIEIINGYTVTFEDGQYAVRLVGSNNNIFDEGVINRNQVSIISTNSAGLQVVTIGAQAGVAEVMEPVPTEIVVPKDKTIQLNFYLRLNSDHSTSATGLTGGGMTINLSKNGAAFSLITPTVVEIGQGWYTMTLTSSHTDTVGPMVIMVESSTTDTFSGQLEVDVRPDLIPGEVTGDIAPSSTTFSTTLSGVNSKYKDCFIQFTSGSLNGEVKFVTGFSSGSGIVTCEAFTSAPSSSDKFVLINS